MPIESPDDGLTAARRMLDFGVESQRRGLFDARARGRQKRRLGPRPIPGVVAREDADGAVDLLGAVDFPDALAAVVERPADPVGSLPCPAVVGVGEDARRFARLTQACDERHDDPPA